MKLSKTLLSGACAALVAVGAALPVAAQAQTKLRIQSAFPAQGLYQIALDDFAERVNAMTAGKLKIELLPSGSVVPAFEVLDAVNKKKCCERSLVAAFENLERRHYRTGRKKLDLQLPGRHRVHALGEVVQRDLVEPLSRERKLDRQRSPHRHQRGARAETKSLR